MLLTIALLTFSMNELSFFSVSDRGLNIFLWRIFSIKPACSFFSLSFYTNKCYRKLAIDLKVWTANIIGWRGLVYSEIWSFTLFSLLKTFSEISSKIFPNLYRQRAPSEYNKPLQPMLHAHAKECSPVELLELLSYLFWTCVGAVIFILPIIR